MTWIKTTGYDRTAGVAVQWNAEGVSKKKIPLAERLRKECIDITCIQESHITDNLWVKMRFYQTYTMDRRE